MPRRACASPDSRAPSDSAAAPVYLPLSWNSGNLDAASRPALLFYWVLMACLRLGSTGVDGLVKSELLGGRRRRSSSAQGRRARQIQDASTLTVTRRARTAVEVEGGAAVRSSSCCGGRRRMRRWEVGNRERSGVEREGDGPTASQISVFCPRRPAGSPALLHGTPPPRSTTRRHLCGHADIASRNGLLYGRGAPARRCKHGHRTATTARKGCSL